MPNGNDDTRDLQAFAELAKKQMDDFGAMIAFEMSRDPQIGQLTFCEATCSSKSLLERNQPSNSCAFEQINPNAIKPRAPRNRDHAARTASAGGPSQPHADQLPP